MNKEMAIMNRKLQKSISKNYESSCKHDLKIIENRQIGYRSFFFRIEHFMQIYTLQCKICGDLKHTRHSLGENYTLQEGEPDNE